MVQRYRSVFISDVHLGAAGCRTERFQHFLKSFDCDRLYLVGDIVDGWIVVRRSKWQQSHLNVIRTILGKSKFGSRIFYTPGNHDAFLRRMNGAELGNLSIDHSFVHETVDGRRLLVVHGDLFDMAVTTFKPLAWLGAWAYEGIWVIRLWREDLLDRMGKKPIDKPAAKRRTIKQFVKKFNTVEDRLLATALDQGYDGVVFGHTHKPSIRELENHDLCINCGDWVENCTAVVEHDDGRFELLYWPEPEEQQPDEREESRRTRRTRGAAML